MLVCARQRCEQFLIPANVYGKIVTFAVNFFMGTKEEKNSQKLSNFEISSILKIDAMREDSNMLDEVLKSEGSLRYIGKHTIMDISRRLEFLERVLIAVALIFVACGLMAAILYAI